jgi:hypothetical protein
MSAENRIEIEMRMMKIGRWYRIIKNRRWTKNKKMNMLEWWRTLDYKIAG